MSRAKRVTVKLVQQIRWTVDVELPARCPHCKSKVAGYFAIEEAMGRVDYDAEGSALDGELPEYGGDTEAHEIRCDSCGETLAAGSVLHLALAAAMAQAATVKQVLSDMHVEQLGNATDKEHAPPTGATLEFRSGRDLSHTQLDALQSLLLTFGRKWKARLRKIWATPHLFANGVTTAALYSIRNTHGPSWLKSARVDFK